MSPICDRLTGREEAVLRLWRHSDKEIAARLGISRRTVSVHMRNIFTKLDVQDRRDAALVAGLIAEVA
jgi:DNA-binding NarL/FixJ family response regulator